MHCKRNKHFKSPWLNGQNVEFWVWQVEILWHIESWNGRNHNSQLVFVVVAGTRADSVAEVTILDALKSAQSDNGKASLSKTSSSTQKETMSNSIQSGNLI